MNLKDYIPGVSKFWTHVAYASTTYLVIFKDHEKLNWAVILVYLAVIGGSSVALKIAEMYAAFKSGAPK